MITHTHAWTRATLLVGAFAVSLAATAQDKPGLYLNVYGGSSSLASTTLTESRTALGVLEGQAKFGSGMGAGGAFGYRYGNGFAAEVAWDYRGHDIKRIGNTAVDGDFASTVLFVNGYYRFDKVGAVRPFVGAGLGYITEIDIDITRGAVEQEYSRRGGLALQAMVGGEVDLTDAWSLTGDLRWTRLNTGAFKSTNPGAAVLNKPKYQPVSLNVGLTYRF
jgi:outer membrane protein W